MEQLCDYKMTDERSVVQHAHDIQSLAKELEYFKSVLLDFFLLGPSLPSFHLRGTILLLL